MTCERETVVSVCVQLICETEMDAEANKTVHAMTCVNNKSHTFKKGEVKCLWTYPCRKMVRLLFILCDNFRENKPADEHNL